MSVRQYIGARYVTKIYENSLDPSSAEWEAGVTYEPLTLVTYLNSSYLSKKAVPGSVGDPSANPRYWVLTGAYNGQILYLQNQIDAINATLSMIGQKKYIVIGDSYGNYTNLNGNTFVDQAFIDAGITDYLYFWRNSSGFAMAGTYNFLSVLQDNEASVPDKDEITDIIVFGSANDQTNTNDILSGITAFTTYVKANYPNAKIQIGSVSHTLAPAYVDQLNAVTRSYKYAAAVNGISFIANGEYIMHQLQCYETDNVHPTAYGVDMLAHCITEYLLTGSVNMLDHISNSLVSGTAATLVDNKMVEIQDNGVINLMASNGGILFSMQLASPVTIAANDRVFVDDLVRESTGCLISTGMNNISFVGYISASNTHYLPVMVFVDGIGASKLSKIGVFIFNNTGSSITLSDADTITIHGSTTTMPFGK